MVNGEQAANNIEVLSSRLECFLTCREPSPLCIVSIFLPSEPSLVFIFTLLYAKHLPVSMENHMSDKTMQAPELLRL